MDGRVEQRGKISLLGEFSQKISEADIIELELQGSKSLGFYERGEIDPPNIQAITLAMTVDGG